MLLRRCCSDALLLLVVALLVVSTSKRDYLTDDAYIILKKSVKPQWEKGATAAVVVLLGVLTVSSRCEGGRFGYTYISLDVITAHSGCKNKPKYYECQKANSGHA